MRALRLDRWILFRATPTPTTRLLFIVLLAAAGLAAPPSTNPARIRALIDKLAISEAEASPDPVPTPSKDTPKSDKRVIAYEAAEALRTFGVEAFPYLLDALDDKRQSVAFRRALPSTVGDACFCQITEQLYALPHDYPGSFYRTGADGRPHERPVFSKALFTRDNVKDWLAAREGHTLVELQLEVLAWVLAEEERIGAATPAEEARFLAPLRVKHTELKAQVAATKKGDTFSSPAARP